MRGRRSGSLGEEKGSAAKGGGGRKREGTNGFAGSVRNLQLGPWYLKVSQGFSFSVKTCFEMVFGRER